MKNNKQKNNWEKELEKNRKIRQFLQVLKWRDAYFVDVYKSYKDIHGDKISPKPILPMAISAIQDLFEAEHQRIIDMVEKMEKDTKWDEHNPNTWRVDWNDGYNQAIEDILTVLTPK